MRVRARAVLWLSAQLLLLPAPTDSARAQAADSRSSQDGSTSSQPARDNGPEIIVTGTRIPRPNLTAVSPVTVIKSDEVERQGVTRVEDMINSLPQAFAAQGAHLSNEASGTATVNLRGVGAIRTLVLINGRRMMPGNPRLPTPDLNTIPAALVERVDLLTGGASSVYGSDAIAGVVNFILKTDIKGLRAYGQTSLYQHDNRDGSGLLQALRRSGFPAPAGGVVDGDAQDINLAGGLSFAGGRGHVTAYAGYRKSDAITQDRRDYSACTSESVLDSDSFNCGGSGTSANGRFRTQLRDDLQVGPDRTFIPGFTPFNFGPYNYFQRPDERKIAGGYAKLALGDALIPYLEAMYMDDRSVAQVAPSGSFNTVRNINCDNPLMSEQQRALVCRAGNFVGEIPIFRQGRLIEVRGTPTLFSDPVTGATYRRANLIIGRRSTETAPRQDDLRHKNLRLVGGVRGKLGKGWSYDAYYLFGRVRFSDTYLNDLSITRLRRSLDVIRDLATGQPACRSALTGEDPDCVPWDIFALNAVSPEAAAYLPLGGSNRGTLNQRSAVAAITGQLGEYGIRSPWADDGLGINLGVEYRKESVAYHPDPVFQTGDLAGQNQQFFELAGAFTVKEAFVEVRLPIVSNGFITDLTIEGGYRRSRYRNPEKSFWSDSYKAGLSFAPIPDIRLRMSYNRAIRAPNTQELFTQQQLGSFIRTDPCAGPAPIATPAQCAAMGVSAAQYGTILENPVGGYQALFGGNPALGPEKAATKTIGVVLRPRFLPGFSATGDWFDIDVKGAIFAIGGELILNYCRDTGDPRYCSLVHRDEFGSLWLTPQGYVDDRLVNIGGFRTRGIDVGLDYRRDIGGLGSVGINVVGTWLDQLIEDDGGIIEPFDCAGLFGFLCGVPAPKWRHKARVTWDVASAISLSVQWRHFGSVKVDSSSDHPTLAFPFSPRDARIKAQDYFDLSALFPITKRYTFRLGVNNVFDREPPIIGGSGQFAVCTVPICNGNTYPQVYDPLGRHLFAGVTVDF